MKITIEEFEKSEEFLVCVDSDGCAMYTMEVKHRKCFGPKIIEVWGLQAIEGKFLETWNMINLYSKTRGINRFKGLVKIFEVLTAEGINMPDFSSIQKWTETSKELSNPALETLGYFSSVTNFPGSIMMELPISFSLPFITKQYLQESFVSILKKT